MVRRIAVLWFLVGCQRAAAPPTIEHTATDPAPVPHEADHDLDADDDLDRGRQEFELGHYRHAIEAFTRYYELTARPQMLYNIAECHRRLGNDQQAIDLYEEYLRQAPDAKNKASVEARIQELSGS